MSSGGSNPRIIGQLPGSGAPLPPLNGRRILVQLVVNVECWSFDAPLPRKLLGSPHGRDNVPDIPNFSWVEYGIRAGLPRILRELHDRGLAASASINSSVIDVYPAAAVAMAEAGWEFIPHGVSQESLPGTADESAVVRDSLSRIERFTGVRPRGWLGPGLAETFATPDVLSASGLEYVCDWAVDDVPLWLQATPRPIVAVPYTLELNDSVLYAAQWHPADEYEHRVRATLAVFEEECEESGPRILTLGLHPHLVAVPHRIPTFRRILAALQESNEVVFVTSGQICDWFVAAQPQPSLGESN